MPHLERINKKTGHRSLDLTVGSFINGSGAINLVSLLWCQVNLVMVSFKRVPKSFSELPS